jgi:hypothetical protein
MADEHTTVVNDKGFCDSVKEIFRFEIAVLDSSLAAPAAMNHVRLLVFANF